MKISEMTLEELQDYAIKLEEQITAKDEELTNITTSNNELHELNKALQKRNNELFLRVEQQVSTDTPMAQELAEEPAVTCEELAQNILSKEIIK